MPDDRPDLPNDYPLRMSRGFFNQPFKPAPGRTFDEATVSDKAAGYTPPWPTEPHPVLAASETVGSLYGDADGLTLSPYVWVGVSPAQWIPGLESMSDEELEDFSQPGKLPLVTSEDSINFGGVRMRFSFDAEFLSGDIYRRMTENDRLYSLSLEGKITPVLPAWRYDVHDYLSISFKTFDVLSSFSFIGEKRTRNNDVMPAFAFPGSRSLFCRDPENLGDIYPITADTESNGFFRSWTGSALGSSPLWFGYGDAGWQVGGGINNSLRGNPSASLGWGILSHTIVDPAGLDGPYLEHGLGSSYYSPLWALCCALATVEWSAVTGVPSFAESGAQILAEIADEATGLRPQPGQDPGGKWEYFLLPHFCPAGGRLTGAVRTYAPVILAQELGNFDPPDPTGSNDGYDYLQLDLVFYRPEHGPNPIVQVEYPPPDVDPFIIEIDLSPPPSWSSTNAGAVDLYFEIDYWFTFFDDKLVDDVSDVEQAISDLIDDMITELNNDLNTGPDPVFMATRLPNENGKARIKLEYVEDPPYETSVEVNMSMFVDDFTTWDYWVPVEFFGEEWDLEAEEQEPIYDPVSSWGWFADLTKEPVHVIHGVPRTNWWDDSGGGTQHTPAAQFNKDNHLLKTLSPAWHPFLSGKISDIYDTGYTGWDFVGNVPPGPWICAIRARYIGPLPGTTTITVKRRYRLPGGNWVWVEEEIEVPANTADQLIAWAALDDNGIDFDYAIRPTAVPDEGEDVTPQPISPWMQILPDGSVVPGHVDRDSAVLLHNWLSEGEDIPDS